MASIDPQMRAGTFPVIDTSMTQLNTWSRCDRKYYYRYVQGLVPKITDDKLQWGTLWHVAMQEYYRGLQGGLDKQSALANAHWAIDKTTLVENKYHGDTEITLDGPVRENMHDVLNYNFETVMQFDSWDEILKVEDPIYLVIGYQGQPVLRIRSTLDVLVRKNGALMIIDHKSTGDVEQDLEFLRLDFQVREYLLAVKAYYEEDAILCYNMTAREVPPGFGRRPLTTETGKKRNPETLANMQRPERYVRREYIPFDQKKSNAFQMALVQIALNLSFEGTSGIWPRREVKTGGMACDKCVYFEPCTAELDGVKIGDAMLDMVYSRDPLVVGDPNAKRIIAPGLPGNPFIA